MKPIKEPKRHIKRGDFPAVTYCGRWASQTSDFDSTEREITDHSDACARCVGSHYHYMRGGETTAPKQRKR